MHWYLRTNQILQGELQMTSNSSTALITGGTSGIGLATARKLAQLGIHVVVVGRNAERGKKAVDEIRAAGGQADFIPSDLHDVASVHAVSRPLSQVHTHIGNGFRLANARSIPTKASIPRIVTVARLPDHNIQIARTDICEWSAPRNAEA
jgi:NAD(P)-dependent dehydrogenase (short-subunit alcohol dehydrogenase family)